MSQTWDDDRPLDLPRPQGLAWLRVLRRGLPMAVLIFGGACVLVVLRLIERPFFGLRRPWTPYITRFACRGTLRLMGLPVARQGSPMQGRGAIVANHSSWLDIFSLNAGDLVYFVSKAEVAGWPGIGWLARITGTVFIERDRAKAKEQTALFEGRLLAGHRLLFFPEGTSTDNRRVLPFKSTLFAAFQTEALRAQLSIQPVSVLYHPPEGGEPRHYGWWGDMDFGNNLLAHLAAPKQGRIKIIYHSPLQVADFADRKSLAAACEAAVRAGFVEAGKSQAV